jgi:SWIM zinc finger
VRVAGVEQVYAYLAPSAVSPNGEVTLATSGGREPHPHFFSGFLGNPRQTAQALLVVAEVARMRYYEPPQMVAARILAADPVVTSNVDRLRFESFSACAGVYARLDLEPELLGGAANGWGTTNVDFNPSMRAALAGIRDADAMLMNVGHDEVAVTTLGGTAVEKKVPLPERWVKGFAEVQVAASSMVLRQELTAIEARRFLRSLPRGKSRGLAWATPVGRALRLAARADNASVCLAGPERLRLLEKLIPFATALRIYGPLPDDGARGAEASAWELVLEDARVVFAVSPELFRGFSGEGGVLVDLAAADEEVVERLADDLHGQPEIEVTTAVERVALGALGAAGRVGYDLAKNTFFHRELPYDRGVLEKMHPRLLGAQRLVEEGAVRLDRDAAYVRSGDVEYLVRGERCTCPWFARHRAERGPCKHVLAVRNVRRQVSVESRR